MYGTFVRCGDRIFNLDSIGHIHIDDLHKSVKIFMRHQGEYKDCTMIALDTSEAQPLLDAIEERRVKSTQELQELISKISPLRS